MEQVDPLNELLLAVLDTAIEIACADFGSIQLVDAGGELVLTAYRGFSVEWKDYWVKNAKGKGCCGLALLTRQRVIIEDLTKEVSMDPEALEVQLRAGVWAVQSTPLFAKDGSPIGVFSTHYRRPWRPTGTVLRTLDSLARLASLVIERASLPEPVGAR